ncbi:MAG: patatin-like phospholipase family protein [Bacteroidetes bacterium]|nr:patatin-like phospholipase family protein [Bacteroidota bacterium]
MSETRVALVLGGGGARGLAHIGILKALEKNNIPIHLIVGTSMGAFVGGFYTAGTGIALMEELALSVDRKFVAKMLAPSFSTSGLVNGERIRSYLEEFLGDLDIEQLRIPFSSVATDLTTGEEVIFSSGPLVDAIMASIAIPALFKPFRYHDRYLVDGGLVNPLPVSVAHRLGADVIIAVNVTPSPSKVGKPSKDQRVFRLNKTISTLRERLLLQVRKFDWKQIDENDPPEKEKDTVNSTLSDVAPPHLFQTLMQSIAVVETNLQTFQLSQWPADVLISPVIGGFNLLDFHRAKDVIDSGEEAANAALPHIRSAIERRTKKR